MTSPITPALTPESQPQDRHTLARSLEETDWTTLSADELHRAAESALTLDLLHLSARLLAHALSHFPRDPRFQELSQILSPPRPLGTAPASHVSSREASRQWLRQHQSQFRGQWVAIKDGHLVAAGPNLDALRHPIEANGVEGTLVVHILP